MYQLYTHTHVYNNKTIKVKQNKRGKLTAELLNNVGKQINYLHSTSTMRVRQVTYKAMIYKSIVEHVHTDNRPTIRLKMGNVCVFQGQLNKLH